MESAQLAGPIFKLVMGTYSFLQGCFCGVPGLLNHLAALDKLLIKVLKDVDFPDYLPHLPNIQSRVLPLPPIQKSFGLYVELVNYKREET